MFRIVIKLKCYCRPRVTFSTYNIPHPWENRVNIRVQIIGIHNMFYQIPTTFGLVEMVAKGILKNKVKYDLDKKTSLIKVDCRLYSSVVYPHNYGFIPLTLCEYNDPLDVLIIMQPVLLGCFLWAKATKDEKTIVVCADDPEYRHYNNIKELPPHCLAEICHFFEDYKKNENKEQVVNDFLPTTVANEAIQHSMKYLTARIKRFENQS
ncbi:hypothetical protein UlMin_000422 [Ulmus minor]